MKRISLFLLVVTLAGCSAATPTQWKNEWVATKWTDSFSDEEFCMVTYGTTPDGVVALQNSTMFYPFVGFKSDSLTVGVRSGGQFRIPVGDVQIRIDERESWTITTLETPIAFSPAAGTAQAGAVTETFTRSLSPFTSTTGERAERLLAEMESGATIRYRTVAMNQPGSTTGQVEIDESFGVALAACRGE